jgi:hypothetical protein
MLILLSAIEILVEVECQSERLGNQTAVPQIVITRDLIMYV